MTVFRSVLTIAGSDPSGGAGIQVDLKTFAATGVWGMAVITALTAQNACRVSGSWAMEPAVVRSQVQTLLEDMVPGAVKTGMLANAGIIRTVAEVLPEGVPLVVDPVLVSTSGHPLLDPDCVSALMECLLPRAMLITPNLPEALVLSGIAIKDESDMIEAGRSILSRGVRGVMVKGGHGKGSESVDLLITEDQVIRLSSPRLPGPVHGTGCCFSAAIASYLALGFSPEEACRQAKELVSMAIQQAVMGAGGMRMVNPGRVTENISSFSQTLTS